MRILIATMTAGGGHNAAAAALEETWKIQRPADVIERVDLLKFFSPLHRKIHIDGYVKLVERAPEVWGMVFKTTDNTKATRRLSKLKLALPSNSRNRILKCFKEFCPDIVLCTHYSLLETLGVLREKPDSPNPFVVSIVTDFEAHALWMEAGVDLYCVAAEETKARLVARGVKPENIVATGIPISTRFLKETDEKAVRQRYGWRDDLPVLLVLSGGFGMGPVAEILQELDKVPAAFQTVVVTGKNEELRRELAAQDRKHPTQILGFATNMHELMSVSALIITKPGGLTTSEAMALGKPLFILNPIPGQEAANSDFLLEHGAAVKVNRVEDLPYRIEQLLASKKLAEMSKAAKKIGRPLAAQKICEEVVKRCQRQSSIGAGM
jgi:processive 1,2-diacylglycerol beta-glucosyltransferase